MSPVRVYLSVALGLLTAGAAHAAAPKEIDDAVQKGSAYLKKFGNDNGKEGRDPDRFGATVLVGLALLETGTPADHPAIKKITERVRDASYTQTQTYQITLCLLYLDRLGDPADVPLIQMLGVRLVAGQNAGGGWHYACIASVPAATERFLRAKLSDATLVAGAKDPLAPKPEAPVAAPGKPGTVGKLHAEVEKYRQGLLAADNGKRPPHDDNSNTQFGVLGVWTARKHGVPVEHALDLIERRFLVTQGTSGGWPYSGPAPGTDGSPSMTCAGLLGLATVVGRREERTLKAEVAKPAPKAEPVAVPGDPFAAPPKKADEPPAPKPKKLDVAIKHGMDNLGDTLAGAGGKGRRGNSSDLYFLWSLERVGIIYGVNKIGNTIWYDYAADALVSSQNADGSWRGSYNTDVDTAFALLVLARSNLARDLAAKVQKDLNNTELRAGGGGPATLTPKPEPAPMPMAAVDPPAVKPEPAKPDLIKPVVPVKPEPAKPDPAKPAGTTPGDIAVELFRATGADWATTLQRVRDAKGPENTSALLAVIPLLEGDRKKAAREALAERLCRMNATTLRGMLKADDAELRRAAALACAMKDDKDHVADLILALEDKEADVVKAARAGLKSLTAQEFATADEWRAWLAKEKK